jgi:hypothetical protein
MFAIRFNPIRLPDREFHPSTVDTPLYEHILRMTGKLKPKIIVIGARTHSAAVGR